MSSDPDGLFCVRVGVSGNNLGGGEAKAITNVFLQLPDLTTVHLEKWLQVLCAHEILHLSPQHVLPAYLPDIRTVTDLDLSGELKMRKNHECTHCLMICFHCVFFVLVSDNWIESEGAKALVPALCEMKQLTSLNLGSKWL